MPCGCTRDQMPRVTNFFSRGTAAASVWIISSVVFYLLFRVVMENSTSTATDSLMSSSERRSRLYDKMARDLDEHGMKFLQGGETSQSLSLNDIFEFRDGSVIPKPKAADPPVRANVLYLSPEFSKPISLAVRNIFLPYFDGGCWQVISGSDPVIIRAKLRNALPHSPEKQLYDPIMLHTSFARILGHPKVPLEDMKNSSDVLKFFHELVARVNNKLHGYKATISELWFVEEYDVLALAIDGKIKVHKFPLGCS